MVGERRASEQGGVQASQGSSSTLAMHLEQDVLEGRRRRLFVAGQRAGPPGWDLKSASALPPRRPTRRRCMYPLSCFRPPSTPSLFREGRGRSAPVEGCSSAGASTLRRRATRGVSAWPRLLPNGDGDGNESGQPSKAFVGSRLARCWSRVESTEGSPHARALDWWGRDHLICESRRPSTARAVSGGARDGRGGRGRAARRERGDEPSWSATASERARELQGPRGAGGRTKARR